MFGVTRFLQHQPGAGHCSSRGLNFSLDVFAFLNPRGSETGIPQHPVGHAPVRIFKGILAEIDRRARAREVVEFALFHGFADLSID